MGINDSQWLTSFQRFIVGLWGNETGEAPALRTAFPSTTFLFHCTTDPKNAPHFGTFKQAQRVQQPEARCHIDFCVVRPLTGERVA